MITEVFEMVNKVQKLEELKELIDKFEQERNKKAFFDSFESWLLSVHNELKSKGLSENEIKEKFSQICIEFGDYVGKNATSEQNELIKDVLAIGILQFIIGIKHQK